MSTPKKKTPAPAPVRPVRPTTPSRPQGLQLQLDDIKGLIALVAKEAIDEFEFQSGEMKFHIRKTARIPPAAPPVQYALPPMPPMPAHTLVATAQPAAEERAEDPGIHHITSPIVGTFYRAPTANGAPFVQPGDFVKPGQTLCIVEAMKLMNEIECDVAGEVVAVMVENGQPVEYGERIFAVRVR